MALRKGNCRVYFTKKPYRSYFIPIYNWSVFWAQELGGKNPHHSLPFSCHRLLSSQRQLLSWLAKWIGPWRLPWGLRGETNALGANTVFFPPKKDRGFPKIVVFPPKWMVKIMENLIKNGWFGGTPIFGNIQKVLLGGVNLRYRGWLGSPLRKKAINLKAVWKGNNNRI